MGSVSRQFFAVVIRLFWDSVFILADTLLNLWFSLIIICICFLILVLKLSSFWLLISFCWTICIFSFLSPIKRWNLINLRWVFFVRTVWHSFFIKMIPRKRLFATQIIFFTRTNWISLNSHVYFRLMIWVVGTLPSLHLLVKSLPERISQIRTLLDCHILIWFIEKSFPLSRKLTIS